jgi:hypothetical protein
MSPDGTLEATAAYRWGVVPQSRRRRGRRRCLRRGLGYGAWGRDRLLRDSLRGHHSFHEVSVPHRRLSVGSWVSRRPARLPATNRAPPERAVALLAEGRACCSRWGSGRDSDRPASVAPARRGHLGQSGRPGQCAQNRSMQRPRYGRPRLRGWLLPASTRLMCPAAVQGRHEERNSPLRPRPPMLR